MPTVTFTPADLTGFTSGYTSGPSDAGDFVSDAPSSPSFGNLTLSGSGTDSTDPRFMGTDFVYRQEATLDASAIPGTALITGIKVRVPSVFHIEMASHAVSDPNVANYDFTIGGINRTGSGGNPAVIDDTYVISGVDAETVLLDPMSGTPIDMATFLATYGTVTLDVQGIAEANGNTGVCSIDYTVTVGGWEMEVTYENEGGTKAIYAASRLGIQGSDDGENWVLLTALFGKQPTTSYPRGMLVYPSSNVLFFTDTNVDPSKLYNYDGENVTENPPPSAGTIFEIMGFTYDSTNDRMYVLYYDDVDPEITLMAYWDGSTWTSVDTSGLPSVGGLIFYSRLTCLGDSLFLFVYNNPSGDGTIYRKDGAGSWTAETTVVGPFGFTSIDEHVPHVMETYGDEIYFAWQNYDFSVSPVASKFLFKRDSVGAWTDISPSGVGTIEYGVCYDVMQFSGDIYITLLEQTAVRKEIWKLSESVWTMDFDVAADDTNGDISSVTDLANFNGVLMAGARDSGSEGLTWSYRMPSPSSWERFTISGGAHILSVGGGSGALNITAIVPPTGNIGGNVEVEIQGTGFDSDVEILFDQIPALAIVWNSSSSLTVTIPPHAIGFVDVTATNPDDGEFDTDAGGFEYVDDLPNMDIDCGATDPPNGTMAGGTTVTIFGSGFIEGTEVFFGGFPATNVVVDPSGTFLTCVTPAHPVGTVDIKVTSPNL